MFSMFIFSLLGKTHENIFQMSKIFIILFGSSKVNLNSFMFCYVFCLYGHIKDQTKLS